MSAHLLNEDRVMNTAK